MATPKRPKEYDDIEANMQKCRDETRRSAEVVKRAELEIKRLVDKVDRHTERLSRRQDEDTGAFKLASVPAARLPSRRK